MKEEDVYHCPHFGLWLHAETNATITGMFDFGLFFDGEKLDSKHDATHDFKRGIGYAGEIEFERHVGIFVNYTDSEGEDLGYYDFIDQEYIDL